MVSAWVFVIWGDPKYLVGAVAGAASLRQVNTVHHVVLLHASMDNIDKRELLRNKKTGRGLFDVVEQTELLRFRVKPLRTRKQMELYGGEFSETANTKWQCLSLVKYQKVMFVDSDIVFRRNCDFLFAMQAPAATFSSPFSETYSRGGFPDPYHQLKHGDQVAVDSIRIGLDRATAAAGSLVLLEPDLEMQKKHIEWMREREPYGNAGSFSAIDEQAITEFMVDQGKMWRHIDPIYQAIPWKKNWVGGVDPLDPKHGAFALHFYHARLWDIGEGNDWPDTAVFWTMWHKFAHSNPKLEKRIRAYMGYYVAPEDMKRVYGAT